MRRYLSSAAMAAVVLLAGCSGGSTGTGTSQATGSPRALPPSENTACSGGVKEGDPGVVRVTCDGPADIKIEVGNVIKDLHGGRCLSSGGVWSATVGVVIDATGVQGTYAGPPVDSVTLNDTATPGKATIQAVLDGKHYFDLGNATLTQDSQRTAARLTGVSEQLSDAPGAKISIDVTC